MSVTAKYMLISWHVGEQNTDLLLGPGSELSELDICETKSGVFITPIHPNRSEGVGGEAMIITISTYTQT